MLSALELTGACHVLIISSEKQTKIILMSWVNIQEQRNSMSISMEQIHQVQPLKQKKFSIPYDEKAARTVFLATVAPSRPGR